MNTTRNPTYNDLINYLDKFVEDELDVRVFRRIMSGSDSTNMKLAIHSLFGIGDWPEERTFSRNMEITDEFCNIEIGKVREKWAFERKMKPYPHRDYYYTILINDLKDLNNLRKYWVENNTGPLVKGAEQSASASASASSSGGGGGGGSDDKYQQIPYADIHKTIARAVIDNNKPFAIMLAEEAGVSQYSDTLEGRVLQRDWDMAKTLAMQRLDIGNDELFTM